jgi:hypothetical protein
LAPQGLFLDEASDDLALAFARHDFEIFLALEALKEALMS